MNNLISRLEKEIEIIDKRIERRNGPCYFDENDKKIRLEGEAEGLEKAIKIIQQFENENSALTLEELRQMEGEPVWTEFIRSYDDETGYFVDGWEIAGAYSWEEDRDIISMCNLEDGNYDVFADLYGKTWLAYRRKPE